MIFRFGGVEFGGQFGKIIVENFDPGPFEIRGRDTERPQRDGDIPGRDQLGSANWAFDLATNRRTLTEALQTAGALEAAWKNPEVRLRPNRKAPLSYNIDGRWRRVYGRPDRFAGMKADVRAKRGVGIMTADFRVMDPTFYDEDEKTVTLDIVPASSGGLTAPLTAPLTATGYGEPRAGFVYNAGDAPTPLKVTFTGPVTDPWVRSTDGWEISLFGSIAYDQTITVDALEGTVLRQDGAPMAGWLTRASRLSRAMLPPGQSELSFGGMDLTGTATAILSWRDASTSIGGTMGSTTEPDPVDPPPEADIFAFGGDAETTDFENTMDGGDA